MLVRPETPLDVDAIRRVNLEAFKDHPVSQQTEHLIVEALRADHALEISLVAEVDQAVVGHIAFSRAQIGELTSGWYLLGPLAVLPAFQRQGIGGTLVKAGLEALRSREASGCVLVGDPRFYVRFGFEPQPGLTCAGVPAEYVLCLRFTGSMPLGEVLYHAAFSVQPD